MEGWKEIEFTKSILKNPIGRNNQINSSEIKEKGKYPVIDQGQSYIAGYTDDDKKVIKKGFPYVIFGDHTRIFKYVDFPFVIGADGTKILSPNTELFQPNFFYFQLLNLDIQNRGYNRHFKLLKEKILKVPPLPEQRKIAYVLSTVQKAVEQQDKLIKTTTELKKALMQKLFTEGLNYDFNDEMKTMIKNGETRNQSPSENQKNHSARRLKQTEIGPVPESWEVVKLGNYSEIKTSYPTLKKVIEKYATINDGEIFHYLKVSDMNLIGNELYIKTSNITFKNNDPNNFKKGFLKPNSLLFPKRGAAISTNKKRITTKYSVLDPNLIGVEPNSNIAIKFLFYYFEMFDLVSLQDNNVIPQLNKHNVASVVIPIPRKDEQLSIISYIDIFERKIDNIKAKKQTLTDLFKTLLHELMTGQRRVLNYDFND
ncbi:MAG: restriction endonuclease subunit S [Bacteroidales bacterium]|nr:restriction endonuclease subunit S [Bacteroidales bacterium]